MNIGSGGDGLTGIIGSVWSASSSILSGLIRFGAIVWV